MAAVVFPYRSMFTGTASRSMPSALRTASTIRELAWCAMTQVEIGYIEPVIGEDRLDRFRHELDRFAEQLTAVHNRYVQPGIELGMVHPGLMAETHPWDVDQLQHVAIRPQARSDIPGPRIVARG